MQLGRFLKSLTPRSAVGVARSAKAAIDLGLLLPWLMTLRNLGRRIRLGTEYGGWIIPSNRLSPASICYCVGCGEDISFDLGLIQQYACAVYGFDPTPRSIQFVRAATAHVPEYRFLEIGIWDCDGTVKFFAPRDSGHVSHSITNLQSTDAYIEIPTRRLRAVLREQGHESLSLLKLDIEGAETTVIRTILEDEVRIEILLVEFDELGFPTPAKLTQLRQTVQALLLRGYQLFNIAGYNFTFVLPTGPR